MAFSLDELKKEISKKSVSEKAVNTLSKEAKATKQKNDIKNKSEIGQPTQINKGESSKTTTGKRQVSEKVEKSLHETLQEIRGKLNNSSTTIESDLAPNQEYLTLSNGQKVVVQKGADIPQTVDWDKVKSSNFGKAYTGVGTGLVNAFTGLPSAAISAATGKDVDVSEKLGLSLKNDSSFQASGIKDTEAYKAGELGGEMLGYVMQSSLANPVTSAIGNASAKTKLGKAISTNVVDAATVGTLQNIGIGYQQGLRGEELARDVSINTGLDLGLGAGLSLIGAGIGKLANVKNVDLPTAKPQTEQVAKPVAKVAETADLKRQTRSYIEPSNVPKEHKEKYNRYIEAVDENLVEYANNVKNGEPVYKPYNLANLKNKHVGKIKELTGVDTTGFDTVIAPDEIRHIEARHGSKGAADNSMENSEDLGRVEWVIENCDTIENANKLSKNKRNADNTLAKQVVYKKQVDGHVYVVEAVPDNKAKKMYITSMYIEKAKLPDKRARAGYNNVPQQTSETNLPLNARVAQKDNSVKLKDLGADTNKTPPKYKQSQSIANEKLGGEYQYETTTHAKRNQAAQQRIETDRAGEYEDLTTKQYYTDEDFATARKIFDEETSSGNTEKANRLLRKVAEQSSLKGQELEAVKHLKDNTPSGKIYKAQQEAVRGEKKIADKNPAQHKKATGDIKKFTDIVNKSAKEATTKDEFVDTVKAEIDKLLTPKVKKVKNTILRNEIFEMVDNLKVFDTDNVDNLVDEIGILIKSRYGIPVVSSKQANEIIGYMQRAENAVSPRERNILIAKADQIIADIQESTAKEKLKSLQRISLLSNPKTLLSRNMGGNLLLASAETIKDLPATFFDQLVSLRTGQRTTTAFSGGKYKETLKGLGKGVADQFSDIKNRVDTSPSRGQYELPNKTIWDYKKSKTGVGRVFNKTMNFLDKVIGKSLQFGDRPFYEAAYKSRKAELESLVKKGKSSLTAEEINESARLFALDRTFQGDTKLAKWAGQLRDTLPLGNLIVPFTQTPANIIDKLLDYSPAGLARACMQLGNVKKGTFDQKRFVDALGRTFTGSGAIMLGYVLYQKGLMTTDIYQEGGKDENNARTLAGEQSYSLKFGDTYISVDWADPIGSLLMIGADFGRGLGEKEELLSVLTGGVTTAVDGVFDRSFLSGLTDLFDNISNEGVLTGVLETFISQIGSQAVPNIVKSINRVVDPVKRETYDENVLKRQLNVIKSGIPGLSKTLPAKINVAGEEVKQYQGRNAQDRAIESLLAPYNKTVTNNHEVNDYLIRLYEKTGNSGVLLDQTEKTFNYEGVQYKLKNAEELSRMQKIQGQEAVRAVKELKQSDEFQKLSNAEKANEVTNALSDAKAKAIEDYLIRKGEYTRTEIEFNKLSDSKKERYDSSKVSKDAYIDYFTTASTDDNTNITQAEARKKLDSMDLTEAQKQYLWSQTNSGWKAKY